MRQIGYWRSITNATNRPKSRAWERFSCVSPPFAYRIWATDSPGRDELKAMVDVIEPVESQVILIVTVGKYQLTATVDPYTKASLHEPIEPSVT